MAATACTSARTVARAGGVLSPTIRSKSLTLAFTRPTGGGIGAGGAEDDAKTGKLSALLLLAGGVARPLARRGEAGWFRRELELREDLRSSP